MLPRAATDYYPDFIDKANADAYFEKFLNFDWKRRHAKEPDPIKTTKYRNNRETVVFGDKETVELIPTIWGIDIIVQEWTPELTKIKDSITDITKKEYNVCLCNLYRDGRRTIGYHSDREEFGSVSSIASISLGQERDFVFRDKKDKDLKYPIRLKHGSLLIMGDRCQEEYEHSVIADKTVSEPRINLTFRLFDIKRYSCETPML